MVASEYILKSSRYIVMSLIIGVVCGFASVLFGWASDASSQIFLSHEYLVYLLPVAGIATVWLYKKLGVPVELGTNDIIKASVGRNRIKGKLAPAIFIGTCLTVLCGGSVGVGGPTMQMGGALGSEIGKYRRECNHGIMVACGMAAALSGMFFTPIASTVFVFELSRYQGRKPWHLMPIFTSAIVAYAITRVFYTGTRFVIKKVPAFSWDIAWKVLIVILAASLASAAFCAVLRFLRRHVPKLPWSPYLGIIIGGVGVILITLYFGSNPYDGPGRNQVIIALIGDVRSDAFFWKAVLTLLAVGFGYKGGMLMPTFCIGALLGNAVGTAIGLDPRFGAAIGLVAMFCASTNCPIATLLAGVELMGIAGIGYYAVASAIAFLLTSHFSIYATARYSNIVPYLYKRITHRRLRRQDKAA